MRGIQLVSPKNQQGSPPKVRQSHRFFTTIRIVVTCSLATMSAVVISPTAAHAATTSVVIPMTIRHANPTETAGLETMAGQTVYPQFGANINKDFTETSKDVHTARSWIVEAKPTLQACDTNVVFSIEGDHKFTHTANNAPLIKAGDEPEVGGLVVDGGDTTLLSNEYVGWDADMAVGKTLAVTLGPTATTVAYANSGIKVVMYVETRDDRDHGGMQSSYTYSGTAKLRVTYDHSGCTSPTAAPQSTTPSATTKKKNTATTKPSAASPTTQAPASVEGTTVENNAYAMGKKISVGKQSGIGFTESSPRKEVAIPHVKKSSGNTVINALTFGTMVAVLGIGMFIFIKKQRHMRNTPGFRHGRS